jgi:hypothetical protein
MSRIAIATYHRHKPIDSTDLLENATIITLDSNPTKTRSSKTSIKRRKQTTQKLAN